MLKTKNIFYKYKGSKFSLNIDKANFKSKRISCILGENGSGKTTFLNILGGHIQPFSGTIFLGGKDITNSGADNRPIVTVFQEIGLFPHLTVAENISLAIEPNRFFNKSLDLENKIKRIITTFKLSLIENTKPNNLSGGQKQRVAIARAVATSPEVLLLDEPTSALDYQNISKLKKLLIELNKSDEAPTIIIVSHDWHFVIDVADDILYIENGELVFFDTIDKFKNTKIFKNNTSYEK